MCIHDSQFQVTAFSIQAFYEYVEERHGLRMKRLEAYQMEMAARDALEAERNARTRFMRLFRLRRTLFRWAPRLAERILL